MSSGDVGWRPGQRFAQQFELRDKLGEGGFGAVWSAVDLATNDTVAIKVLRVQSAELVRRFENEARALEEITNVHCVRLLKHGTHAGQPYLVTEFAEGITLDEWRPGRSLPEIVDVAKQIAEALESAHARSIVHRDLKPANVLVRPDDGFVKVLDFGIAKLVGRTQENITQTGEVIGTPGYMSPEQLLGARDLGPQSDLYGLGVMMFEMIEGRPPFEGSSALETAMAHLRAPVPTFARDVPPRLALLVMQLLEKEANERPRLREAQRELDQWDQSPPQARRRRADDETPRRAEPGSLRTPMILATGLLAAVAVLTVTAAALFVTTDEPHDSTPAAEVTRHTPSFVKVPVSPAPAVDQQVAAKVDSGPSIELACPELDDEKPGITDIGRALDGERVAVRIPRGYDRSRKYPIVMMFHDAAQTPGALLQSVDDSVPEVDRFVLVAPHHDDPVKTWEGDARQRAWEWIEDLSRRLCVDVDRLYAIGHGSGGAAAEISPANNDAVRGIATSSHRRLTARRLGLGDRPTPYLFLAPDRDPTIPAEGGDNCVGSFRVSIDTHLRLIHEALDCEGEPTERHEYVDGVCQTWSCTAPFTSCRIEGGRPWPGQQMQARTIALLTGCHSEPSSFPYTEVVFDFFAALDREDP